MGRERHAETLKGNLPVLASGKFPEEERDRPGGVQSSGGLPVRGDSRSRGPGPGRRRVSMTEMQWTLNPWHGGDTSVKEGDFSRHIH